jgi:cysteine desulfurase
MQTFVKHDLTVRELPVYLDCNATTRVHPLVAEEVMRFMVDEFGNPGSRTHEYGTRAKRAVERARGEVASRVSASPEEVIFTSGATESNNIAILGLAASAASGSKRHIVSTQIEHKAVLEPLLRLEQSGYEITLVRPGPSGAVDAEEVVAATREDTLLVSVMHANNETGSKQPIAAVCRGLSDHPAYIHVDAAQTFGKLDDELRDSRIDLISISGHKIFGPKGVGALVSRRRNYKRIPLESLQAGGGQERGLRPGTLAAPLIVGLGKASELASEEAAVRASRVAEFRAEVLAGLAPIAPDFNGDLDISMPHVVNFSIPGVDSEAFIVASKDLIAVSNGSACTSQSYTLSHVLLAMGLSEERVRGAIRMSWCHETPSVNWQEVVACIQAVR